MQTESTKEILEGHTKKIPFRTPLRTAPLPIPGNKPSSAELTVCNVPENSPTCRDTNTLDSIEKEKGEKIIIHNNESTMASPDNNNMDNKFNMSKDIDNDKEKSSKDESIVDESLEDKPVYNEPYRTRSCLQSFWRHRDLLD